MRLALFSTALLFLTMTSCKDLEQANNQSSVFGKTQELNLSAGIAVCFSQMKVSAIEPFLGEDILLTDDRGDDFFSKEETLLRLQDFFAKHPVRLFTPKHQLKAPGGKSEFIVGIYEDKKKQKFRVEISAFENEIDEIDICLSTSL